MNRTHGLRIGSIGGVEVRIDPSWTFIALLVGYTFYALLAVEFAQVEAWRLVAAAAVMALVFFASVLLHELAHSWMARARGIEVRGITLFVFGGATEADLDAAGPRDEFVIAGVGPACSLAIAAVMWGTAVAAGPGLLGYGAGRLGWINLALGVFNLLPGFPLDGGRLLRSWVWRSTGDIDRATRVAARSGQTVGHVLVGIGVLEVLFFGSLIGGLWMVAIGWFLGQSAQASYLQLQLRRVMAGTPAWQLVSDHPVEIPDDTTVKEAVDDYLMRHDAEAFLVRGGGGICGILERSAVHGLPGSEWQRVTVADICESLSDAPTVEHTERMDRVLDLLAGHRSRYVIVTRDGEVIGAISNGDVSRWIQRSRDLGVPEPVA